MGVMLLALVLSQAPSVTVVVIDVSAPDAIYEDVSRGLAEQVVTALKAAGAKAERVDEGELPPGGCRIGPCLGEVARARGAQVVVALDAEEVEGAKSRVAVSALASVNGEPLAAGRYLSGRGVPRALERFAKQTVEAGLARLPAPSQPAAR